MKVVIPTGKERLSLIAPCREILPTASVLEIIEPVDPDNLRYIGNGVYEGRWQDERRGVAEIAHLATAQSARVIVTSENACRPEGLPNWIAVEFCIVPLPMQSSAEVN